MHWKFQYCIEDWSSLNAWITDGRFFTCCIRFLTVKNPRYCILKSYFVIWSCLMSTTIHTYRSATFWCNWLDTRRFYACLFNPQDFSHLIIIKVMLFVCISLFYCIVCICFLVRLKFSTSIEFGFIYFLCNSMVSKPANFGSYLLHNRNHIKTFYFFCHYSWNHSAIGYRTCDCRLTFCV